jgi:hypothetical protein
MRRLAPGTGGRRPASLRFALASRQRTWTCAGVYDRASQVLYVEITLPSGDVFTVEGSLDEVEKRFSDAARSGQSRLAWFRERGRDDPVGLNPAHVVALRASEISD